MRSSKLLLYTLTVASLAILPTLQHTAKGPQYPLQEPAPVNFVQSILANNEPKDYCNVSIEQSRHFNQSRNSILEYSHKAK
jgi:hypothetical protein